MSLQSLRVVIVAIASFIMGALRTVIVATRMEKNEMATETYYLPDTPDVYAFAVVSIILVVLFGVFAFSFGKKKCVDLERTTGSVPTGSLVLGFSLLFAAFVYTVSVFMREDATYSIIEIFVFVFAILSTARFFHLGLCSKGKNRLSFQAAISIAPLLLAVFRLLSDFIRKSAAPFSSSGAYHILALVAVMLFFLLEGKSFVSPTLAVAYFFCGYIAIFFSLVYAIPNLVLHCFGTFSFDYLTAYSVVDFGIATYIATRLSSAKTRKMVSR